MIETILRNGFAVFGLLAMVFAIGRYLLMRNRRSVTMRARLKRRIERVGEQ